jgi:outer membrane protein TolC
MTATIVQYFNLARLQEQNQIDSDNLLISLRRFERASLKNQMGSGSSFERSSSEVDLRNDSLQFIQTQAELNNARRALNTLMGRERNDEYLVNVQVQFEVLPSDSALYERMTERNSNIRRVRSTEKAQNYAKRIAGSAFIPRLDFSAAYNYSAQENEVGLLLLQRNNGLNAGLTLQWDLFNGNQNLIRNQNAQLAVEQAKALKEQQLLQSKQELANALEIYEQALFAVEIARRNVKTSELNFQRAQELFSLGQIDNTQFREAQLNLQNSIGGRNNALFTAKVAETEVLRICGLLVGDSIELE